MQQAIWQQSLMIIFPERILHPEEVYNMDETGLNFKILPQQIFTSQEKSAAADK